jgi:hypothetical protein
VERKTLDDIVSKLAEDKDLLKYFNANIEGDQASITLLTELAEKSLTIEIFEGYLHAKGDDDTRIKCPFVDTNVSESGFWLSDLIPLPSFDIEQNGNVRKSTECIAAYKCAIIAGIMQGEFKTGFFDVVNDYDFSKMDGKDVEGSESLNFKNLLEDWSQFQSTHVSIIISAAKYKLSEKKRDVLAFVGEKLSPLEMAGLNDLRTAITRYISTFEVDKLSVKQRKALNKIELLTLISERDSHVERMVLGSKYRTPFRIHKLSSEHICANTKIKLQRFVRTEVGLLIEKDPGIIEKVGDSKTITKKIRKRVFRAAVISLKKQEFEKYVECREEYVLPPKV